VEANATIAVGGTSVGVEVRRVVCAKKGEQGWHTLLGETIDMPISYTTTATSFSILTSGNQVGWGPRLCGWYARDKDSTHAGWKKM